MELTNAIKKMVSSLDESKFRKKYGLFKAEGTKCVLDTIHYFETYALFATERWAIEHGGVVDSDKLCVVQRASLNAMSSLSTPSDVIAVYKIPDRDTDYSFLKHSLTIALDSVQDPGNMGTIIRTADWFGVKNIICSPSTVDIYNPKVIQSTMGAISRVNVVYTDLIKLISDYRAIVPVYGMSLDGNNLYDAHLTSNGIIVMGNEGKGISKELAAYITDHLLIPSYPVGEETSESLNVAVATAVTLSEFRRRL